MFTYSNSKLKLHSGGKCTKSQAHTSAQSGTSHLVLYNIYCITYELSPSQLTIPVSLPVAAPPEQALYNFATKSSLCLVNHHSNRKVTSMSARAVRALAFGCSRWPTTCLALFSLFPLSPLDSTSKALAGAPATGFPLRYPLCSTHTANMTYNPGSQSTRNTWKTECNHPISSAGFVTCTRHHDQSQQFACDSQSSNGNGCLPTPCVSAGHRQRGPLCLRLDECGKGSGR